ncbi:hypothetical protein [Paenibacillus humicus]|uniref:hypothetical protein n=1 Tax=Paenibacillus humicus TaxID=412861 RepID=UPI003F17F147
MKKAVAASIVLGVLAGCSTPASEKDSPPSAMNNARSMAKPAATAAAPDAKQIQVKYTPSTVAAPLTKIDDLEKPLQLTSKAFDDSTVVVYEKNDDGKSVYAVLQTKEGSYEIGQIGYEGAIDYSINTVEALGQSYIKVTGTVGANAPISDYVSLTTSPPALLHIEANTVEADLDQDGIKEVVATVGTAAETTLYKTVNGSLASVNLNETMNASIVIYDPKTNIFQAEVANSQLSNWKMKDNQLQLIH